MNPTSERTRDPSPVRHIQELIPTVRLTISARLLALTMALRLRRTQDGHYVIWRGRASLARLTGLTTRTLSKARAELLEAGVFRAVSGVSEIVDEAGKVYHVARGVRVLELIWDRERFLKAREEKRRSIEKGVELETHRDRVPVQNRFLKGELDEGERLRQEDELRSKSWRRRGRRW